VGAIVAFPLLPNRLSAETEPLSLNEALERFVLFPFFTPKKELKCLSAQPAKKAKTKTLGAGDGISQWVPMFSRLIFRHFFSSRFLLSILALVPFPLL
jgi:hypothetical protein